ncbi:MAG: 3-isopropylmalate dehydratase large subunit [Actinomycetota bacterium]|nr:3-isopropylmalate dehydratase large subunit [Actinomycetota bacterium]
MGRTISEKILGAHAQKEVAAGEIVVARVDSMMAQDGTAPLAIRAFNEMGGEGVSHPERIMFCIDHNAPSPLKSVSELHALMRKFASENNLELSDIGEGVCHQLMVEKGRVLPGELVIGADSHTCTYGALNSFATGVGSTDFAAAMLTGELWFRVPETMRINVRGKLPAGVYAKDIALSIVGMITADGATYQAIEFSGEVIRKLSLESRLTICNLSVEMGAKVGLMEADEKLLEYVGKRSDRKFSPVKPDRNASYAAEHEVNVGELTPLVSLPHQVDRVLPVEEVEGTIVSQGLIGTCTNGRLEDLRISASILCGKKIAKGTRLIIAPASREIMLNALREGLIEVFIESGCVVVPPGCASCVGTHQGIPSDEENVISTANRNFKGRMGNPSAYIYLASPATVAASCVEGKIADPRKYIRGNCRS